MTITLTALFSFPTHHLTTHHSHRASGGAGKLEHLYDAVVEGGADAVLMASITHFENYTIKQMKEYLASRGIPMNL